MTQDNLKDYTFTGVFSLCSGNTILGEINYVENTLKHYRLYRISDFIRTLKLPRNFTVFVDSRYKFPGARHCWASWIALKSALRDFNRPTDIILDIMNRKSPEENPTPIKFEKKNRLLDFLLRLPDDKLLNALSSFEMASRDFGAWVKQFGGKPEDFLLKDLEEFSALDFVDLLKSYNFRFVKASELEKKEEKKTHEIPGISVKELEDGKNLQITLNLKLL